MVVKRAQDALFEKEFAATGLATRQVLSELRARLAAAGADAALLWRVETVLAEVLNNIAEHAYAARGNGTVHLRAVRGDDELRALIRDAGGPMPGGTPPGARLPDIAGPRETLPEGGFGWFLIRSQTDSLTYRRENGENRLELCFRWKIGS